MKRISLALSFILLALATVQAQLNPVWTSIDLSVAQASRVVIGHIAKIGKACGTAERNSWQQPIILAVDETLKGERVSRLLLVIAYDPGGRLNIAGSS